MQASLGQRHRVLSGADQTPARHTGADQVFGCATRCRGDQIASTSSAISVRSGVLRTRRRATAPIRDGSPLRTGGRATH
jgi:hypothetical protein